MTTTIYRGPRKRAEDTHFLDRLSSTLLRWQPLVLVTLAVLTGLGLKWMSPNERITAIEQRVGTLRVETDELSQHVRFLTAARCLELSAREIQLIQEFIPQGVNCVPRASVEASVAR